MSEIEKISEDVLRQLSQDRPVVYAEEKLGRRTLKILGLQAALTALNAADQGDPWYSLWAQDAARLIAEYMCGPAVPGVNLVMDRAQTCPSPPISSEKCLFQCAPIMGINKGGLFISTYPPCHAAEAPSCDRHVSHQYPCVKIKAVGCESGSTVTVAYSLLDDTAEEYPVYAVGLYREDKLWVSYESTFPIANKSRDDLLYVVFRILIYYNYKNEEACPLGVQCFDPGECNAFGGECVGPCGPDGLNCCCVFPQ